MTPLPIVLTLSHLVSLLTGPKNFWYTFRYPVQSSHEWRNVLLLRFIIQTETIYDQTFISKSPVK